MYKNNTNMISEERSKNADGTCLQDTMYYCWDLKRKGENMNNWRIIHAIVERASDKLRHPHAVVYNVKTKEIYEVSNRFKNKPMILPFLIWSQMGNISNMKNWDIGELNYKNSETMTWEFHHLKLTM